MVFMSIIPIQRKPHNQTIILDGKITFNLYWTVYSEEYLTLAFTGKATLQQNL